MRSHKKNYSPIELEALAIIHSLSKLRHILLGRRFKVLTDHCALCVLNRRSPQNARVARWAIALSEYDFEIVHVKGKCHEDVDCLSRAPVDTPHDDYLEHLLSVTESRTVGASQQAPLATPVDKRAWLNYEDEESARLLLEAERRSSRMRLVTVSCIAATSSTFHLKNAKRW